MAHPLPQIDFDAMTSARMSSITMASDNLPPLFIDTTLLVEEFIAYYIQYNNNNYDGIRFYPQYENDGRLYNAICIGKLGADDAFCLLKEVDYTLPGNSFVNVVPSSTVQANLDTYRNNILIEGNAQNPGTYLRSRFFDWASIQSFFKANIHGFDINKPATYRGYTLKVKIAYTNETLSEKFFNTYHVGNNATEQIGFTLAFSLVDPTGNLLINPTLPFQAGEFANVYLEMGVQCPTECGSL